MDRSTASAARPTIHTVAERAGVSKSLVSLVLRGSPKVSPDRRAAVQRAIAELGYRPNIAARDLRQRRSRTVGVLLNDIRHPWFVDLLDGLTDALAEQGRQLLLNSGRLDRARDDTVPRTLADLGVEGMVLVGTQAGSAALAEVAAGRAHRRGRLARPGPAAGRHRRQRRPARRRAGHPAPDRAGPPPDRAHRRPRARLRGRGRRAAPARLRGHDARARPAAPHPGGDRRPHRRRRLPGGRAAAALRRTARPRSSPSTTSPAWARRRPPPSWGWTSRAGSRSSATTTPSSPGCARSGSPAWTASARRWAGSRPGRWPPGSTTRRSPAQLHLLTPALQVRGSSGPAPGDG